MKRKLLALAIPLIAALAIAPQAYALHTVDWAAQQACAQTQAFANAAGASGPCGYLVPQSGWNLPGHPNRFWVVIVHNEPGGICHPQALNMGVEVTDGGTATTNTNDWYWWYTC